MTTVTGSCLCGAVRYQVDGPLRPIIACHCAQCRKMSGHYVAATQAAIRDVTITGESLRWHQSSESAARGFCGTCGSSLFWRPFERPVISIFAGTIDGPTGLRIESQLYTEDAGDYYELPDAPIIPRSELE